MKHCQQWVLAHPLSYYTKWQLCRWRQLVSRHQLQINGLNKMAPEGLAELLGLGFQQTLRALAHGEISL